MLSRKRTLLIIVVGITLLLLLSACKMEVHTKVNADGSGEMSIAFELANSDLSAIAGLMGVGDVGDDEVLDYILQSQGYDSVEEFCAGMQDETGGDLEDAVVEANRTDEGLECIITWPFESLEELMAEYEGDEIEISIVDGTFTYRMAGADTGLDTEEFTSYQSMLGIDIEMLWIVTAPGKVSSHNGTSIDGTTVTWDLIELGQSGDFTMELTSSTSSGGGGMDTNTIIIIGVVVLVVVLLLMSQRKKPSEEV